jgi:hypothetical protein
MVSGIGNYIKEIAGPHRKIAAWPKVEDRLIAVRVEPLEGVMVAVIAQTDGHRRGTPLRGRRHHRRDSEKRASPTTVHTCKVSLASGLIRMYRSD